MERVRAASSSPRTRKSRARVLHLELVPPGNRPDAIVLTTAFAHSNAIVHAGEANTYQARAVPGLRDQMALHSSSIEHCELRKGVAIQRCDPIDLEKIQAPIIAQSSLRFAFAPNRSSASGAMMRASLIHIVTLFPSSHGSMHVTILLLMIACGKKQRACAERSLTPKHSIRTDLNIVMPLHPLTPR